MTVLAKVWRGELVESVHRGDWVVVDATGNIVASSGDPDKLTYFRSAAKPIQALTVAYPEIISYYQFNKAELAVMCASHSGEDVHVATVEAILHKVGLDYNSLRCGVHLPQDSEAKKQLLQSGKEPNQLHNNCSGKHAGMLALCRFFGWPMDSYPNLSHPLQQQILTVVSELSEVERDKIILGIDGCGVPVYGISIYNMALAWAKLVDPRYLTARLKIAADNVTEAMRSHPFIVAGTNRICTDLMNAFADYKLVAKSGAEAVYCLGLPDNGWGLALKIEDGNSRAIPAVVLAILTRLGYSDKGQLASKYSVIRNHHGQVVGKIEPWI